MKTLKQSVGIDVSKDSFSVCFAVREIDKEFRIVSSSGFRNNSPGFKQFSTWFSKRSQGDAPLHFRMEATGVYYEELAYFLHGRGCRLCVLLPNKSSAYTKSLDYKSKSDRIDSKILAQMALERELPVWTPPSGEMLALKGLCREREELLRQKTLSRNRLHSKEHAHQSDKKSLSRGKSLVQFLQKQIDQIEEQIRSVIKNNPSLKEKVDLLRSIKGVGWLTAAVILGETNGFALFKNKAQVVSYAGYDVVERTSGTSIHSAPRISKKGNKHIRRALYFPALTAARHEPLLCQLYERVWEKTKIKMKAYVALQRKLLVLMYTLCKKNQRFDPHYLQNRQESLPA